MDYELSPLRCLSIVVLAFMVLWKVFEVLNSRWKKRPSQIAVELGHEIVPGFCPEPTYGTFVGNSNAYARLNLDPGMWGLLRYGGLVSNEYHDYDCRDANSVESILRDGYFTFGLVPPLEHDLVFWRIEEYNIRRQEGDPSLIADIRLEGFRVPSSTSRWHVKITFCPPRRSDCPPDYPSIRIPMFAMVGISYPVKYRKEVTSMNFGSRVPEEVVFPLPPDRSSSENNKVAEEIVPVQVSLQPTPDVVGVKHLELEDRDDTIRQVESRRLWSTVGQGVQR